MAFLPPPEILFFPFPSPGHYLPLIDIAYLLASHGANSTVVVSPAIISRLPPSLLSSSLRFISIPFPSSAAGLPAGISTVDSLPAALFHRFVDAVLLLRIPFTDLLLRHSPDAVISDSLFPFIFPAASSIGIPCFSFPGTGLFALSLDLDLPAEIDTSLSSFNVPNLPDPVHEFFNLAREAYRFSSGIVANSFEDLEPGYAEHHRKTTGKRVYLVGPVSIAGIRTSADHCHRRIIDWLRTKTARSVIYVCFGSLCRFPANQILELGIGLEESGVAFVWVIGPMSEEDDEEVVRIEERVGERGVVVRGWLENQPAVLRQSAIGGFLTHCGWGAVTEAAAAGVPMLTWPIMGDQFNNEKLVKEVAGIGIEIGVKKSGVLVGRARVRERVRWLMAGDGCGETDRVRKKAEEMKEKARSVMEFAGDSYAAAEDFLRQVRRPAE